jgi:predicted peroxiredoxin
MDGLIAQEWETDMLRYLKKNGAKLGPKEVAGKFDGYSEAWLKENFEMSGLSQLIEAIRDSGH